MNREQIIQKLSAQLREWERPHSLAQDSKVISTGITALDKLLPNGGLEPGTVVEWLAVGEASGATTLGLMTAAQSVSLNDANTLVVIDETGQFYPLAATTHRIDLHQIIQVRTVDHHDTLWALEQSLRCPAAVTVMSWVDHIGNRASRRLQLAARSSGSIGLLIRPVATRRCATWADVRLLVRPLPSNSSESGRRMFVEVLRSRGGRGGGAVELELDDESGHVRLATSLATTTALHLQATRSVTPPAFPAIDVAERYTAVAARTA